MRVIRNPGNCPEHAQRAVVALGNFDGVHVGHRAILQTTLDTAKTLGMPAAVMTFEPHPREFFSGKRLHMVSLHQKLELIRECGMDVTFILRFNKRLAETTAHDFVIGILHDSLKASHVVTGYNFAFGKGREGNTEMLLRYAREAGFGFTACPPVERDGTAVSSTTIRECLTRGDIAQAEKLLGHPYRICGHVRAGAEIGRTIGFPTANLVVDTLFKPRLGVYAVRVRIEGDDREYDAVANLGVKPTFNPSEPLLEVHIFDFDAPIYSKRIDVTFVSFLRDEQRFANVEALKAQIRRDVTQAQAVLGKRRAS